MKTESVFRDVLRIWEGINRKAEIIIGTVGIKKEGRKIWLVFVNMFF